MYGNPDFTLVEQELKQRLLAELEKSNDPRVAGPNLEDFDSYIRYSPMREFPPPED